MIWKRILNLRVKRREKIMIKEIIGLSLFLGLIPLMAMKDQDFDGVADSVDECPKTPFLNEVNAKGCSVNVLTLPSETESDSLVTTLSYGLNTNEDLLGREKQHSSKLQVNYYHDKWSYSLSTGYYRHAKSEGALDTEVKVKHYFKLTPKLKLRLGVGVKLPTYDFIGNKTDYTLYSSLNYYVTPAFSLFSQYNYSYIHDINEITPLRNSYASSFGAGYFFTKDFYSNLAYHKGQSKFTNEHNIESLSSSLYYKIDQKWFGTLFYDREIYDEDFHETINFKIGYKWW